MTPCVLASQVPASTLETLRLSIQAEETIADGKKKIFIVTERAIEKLCEHGYSDPEYSECEFDGVSLVTFKRCPAGAAAPAAEAAEAAAPAETEEQAKAKAAKAKAKAKREAAEEAMKAELAAPPIKEGEYPGECNFSSWDGTGWAVVGTGAKAHPVNYKELIINRVGIPISRLVGLPVVISVPHNRVEDASEGDVFAIHIWSSDGSGEDPAEQLTKLFDIPVSCRDSMNCMTCSSDNFIPLRDPKGALFGAMNQYNLYLYWDAVHTGVENEVKILLLLPEVVKANLGKNPQAGSPEDERLAEENYINLTKKRFDALEAQLRQSITTREAEIHQLSRNITEKIRLNQVESINLAGFLSKGVDLDGLRTEYKMLRSLPRVLRVKTDATAVTVYTDLLYVEDPRTKKQHVVGRFRIVLKSDGTVQFHNMTHKITGMNEGMNAPHVYADGHACLGSMSNVLPNLISGGEYSAAAQMAIAFLESCNVDDGAGRHVNKWPERSEWEAKNAAAEGKRKERLAKAKASREGAAAAAK